MALATRCPQCGTTFKVAHDQLKLRAGMVRCGACKQVFNGIEHLVRNQADEVIAPKALSAPAPPLTPPVPAPTPSATPAPSPVPSATPATTIPPVPTPAPTLTPAPTFAPLPTLTPEPTVTPKPTRAPTISPLPSAAPAFESTPEPLTTPAPSSKSATEPRPSFVAAPADAFPALQQDSKLVLEHIDAPPPPLDFTPGNTLVEEFKPSVKTRPAPMLDDGSTLPPIAVQPAAAAADPVPAENRSAPTETPELPDERHEPTFDAGELASDIEQEAVRKQAELEVLAKQDGSDAEEPDFVKRGRRSRGVQRVVNAAMVTLSVFLFFIGLGQAGYAFRNQLAASLPASKPWLENACIYLNCKVGLPVQIKAVSLEADELQTLPRVKNMFALSTLLRNHSSTPQSWPYIELSLNDAKDKVLARRVFAPRDYLANPQDEVRGFAANGEQAVKLYFELSQIKASGYRVYLFYP